MDTINCVELFVRENLLGILKDICAEIQVPFNDCDKFHFFGMYSPKPETFRFHLGEKASILGMVKYVQNAMAQDTKMFDAPAKHHLLANDTVQLSFGLFFGKQGPHRSTISTQSTDNTAPATENSSVSSLVNSLIPKLVGEFNLIVPGTLENLPAEKVKIVNNGSRIFATVECIFCPNNKIRKPLCIQYDTVNNGVAAYWNVSNFRKHLRKHIPVHQIGSEGMKKEEQVAETTHMDESSGPENLFYETIEVENLDESLETYQDLVAPTSTHSSEINNEIEKDTVSTNVDVEIVEITPESVRFAQMASIEKMICDQISSQNSTLTQAIMANSEEKHVMKFRLGDEVKSVKIIKIKPDGNCLFGALAHQLFLHKINSKQHVGATAKLRTETVSYIKDNVEKFKDRINYRILDERKASEAVTKKERIDKGDGNITDKNCKAFLTELKKNKWGGNESIQAISEIYRVNILVFKECGSAYFPFGFDIDFHRTVMVSYQIDAKNIYNHYNSLVGLDKKLLDIFAKSLAVVSVK